MTTSTSFIRVEWSDGWCRATGDEFVGEQDFPWTNKGEAEAKAFAERCGGKLQYLALL